MQVFCYEDGRFSNFGDDLNVWLWNDLLPGCWEDLDDGILFCGIGSIIGRRLLPPARKYIVFSSGTGYDPPPSDFGSAMWDIHCVRGPLTARVLGLADSKAIADGAILISLLPQYAPLPESERSGVVFMPHYEALQAGDWKQVAERAGVECLDPHADSRKTVESIRRAKLVLADAMHAAIIADSLRVPWIPLTTSRQINTFKWLDWTLSLNIPYRPISLPSSSLLESVRNATLGWYGHDFALQEQTFDAAIKHYENAARWKQKSWWHTYAKWARRLGYIVPSKLSNLPVINALQRKNDERYIDRAAGALRLASTTTQYLSDDSIFRGRVDELWTALLRVPEIAAQRR